MGPRPQNWVRSGAFRRRSAPAARALSGKHFSRRRAGDCRTQRRSLAALPRGRPCTGRCVVEPESAPQSLMRGRGLGRKNKVRVHTLFFVAQLSCVRHRVALARINKRQKAEQGNRLGLLAFWRTDQRELSERASRRPEAAGVAARLRRRLRRPVAAGAGARNPRRGAPQWAVAAGDSRVGDAARDALARSDGAPRTAPL